MTGPEDTLARVRAACDAARAVLDAPSGRTASAWWDKREDVEPEDLLALMDYIEANEAWLDPTVNPTVEAMTERNVSFNAARRALGLGDA